MKRNLISMLVGIGLFANVSVAAQTGGIVQECLDYLNPGNWSNTTKACAVTLVAVGVGTYLYYFDGSVVPVQSASCPLPDHNEFFYQIHSGFEPEKNTYPSAKADYPSLTYICQEIYKKIGSSEHALLAHAKEILKDIPKCVCVDGKFGGIRENATHFFCIHKIEACQCSYTFVHEISKTMVTIIRPGTNQ